MIILQDEAFHSAWAATATTFAVNINFTTVSAYADKTSFTYDRYFTWHDLMIMQMQHIILNLASRRVTWWLTVNDAIE